MTAADPFRPTIWTPGDWNAFFGFGTNILVNMLVLTGLLRFVLKMPDSLVFGRILPALGLMMCLSTMYYAWLAYRLALKTGRSDVCALPSGVSVPHMFVVTFVIMLPITIKTGDPAQRLGGGSGVGVLPKLHPDDRRFHRAVYPQDHAARSVARHVGRRVHHLHLDAAGARNVHDADHRHRLLRHHHGELVRRLQISEGHSGRPGRDRGGHADRVGFDSVRPELRRHELRKGSATRSPISASRCRSRPFDHVFSGFEFLGIILVTAIPFGIYDLVEAMDNVESAEAAGDALSDHARADRRRRGQPDRLPDGQPFHQRRLYRPSRLEGDGRPYRLFGRDRAHGDRAVVVRHHRGDARR